MGIAEIYWADKVIAIHKADESVDQVVHIAEAASLRAVAEKSDGLIAKSLQDEIADDSSIVSAHPWSIGIENASDADVYAGFAVEIKKEGLSDTFAFVVAASRANGVDVSPVVFSLGVLEGIAVDFRSGGLEDASVDVSGEAEHVNGSHDRG